MARPRRWFLVGVLAAVTTNVPQTCGQAFGQMIQQIVSNISPDDVRNGMRIIGNAASTVQQVINNQDFDWDPKTHTFDFKMPQLRSSPVAIRIVQTMATELVGGSDQLTPEQKAQLTALIVKTIVAYNSSASLRCSWQATVSAFPTVDNEQGLNIAFPDANAIYHVIYLPPLSPTGAFMIEGDFPLVRYFGYQLYDENQDPVYSLRDWEIAPLRGTNPFKKDGSSPSDKGTYRILITYNGTQGFANEMPSRPPGTPADKQTSGGFVLLRMYAWDSTLSDKTSVWGGVNPPEVKSLVGGEIDDDITKVRKGDVSIQVGQLNVWASLPLCPAANTGLLTSFMGQADYILSTGSTWNGNPCARYNIQDNFALFKRTGHRVPFPNGDAQYLLGCGQSEGMKGDFVAVVTGQLPRAPAGLYDKPTVADARAYDVRYVSLSSVDMAAPGPVIQTVFDADFADFYGKVWGDTKTWRKKGNMAYRVVLAPSEDVARRCGVMTTDSMLLKTTGKDGKPVGYPGIIYRELIERGDRLGPNQRGPRSVLAVKDGCDGEPACTDPWYAAQVMGDNYPRVTYYDCQRSKLMAPPINGTYAATMRKGSQTSRDKNKSRL